jgi:hypothetical protein
MMLIKNLGLSCALSFVIVGAATTAIAQQNPSVFRPAPPPKPASGQQGPPTGKLSETKPPAAHYDIGDIVKRLAALEGQVGQLKKENAALETQLKKMQVTIGSINVANAASAASANKVTAELQRFDNALRSHTHAMPSIGIMALSAIPGMQDMANKAGIGAVIQQWQGMKMLWTIGNGGNLERVGPAILPAP